VALRILALDEARAEWDRTFESLPDRRRDVYFSSAYALVWERNGDGRAMGAIWEEPGARILYPFLLRDLARLEGGFADGLFDISTAYGYGGPAVDAPSADRGTVARFRAAFDSWCRENRVVSEFIRFHPLLENHRVFEPHLEVIPVGETVWCRVDLADDELVAAMESGHRRNLRKARNAGIEARVAAGPEAYDAFRELYSATMSRRNAASSYFFGRSYFESFRDLLGDRQALLGVWLGDEMIAGGLLMRYGAFSHYHLGGSSAAHLGLRPNNLFFYQSMLWARESGAEVLHLGGGYRRDDDLLRFKRGLGTGRATFAVGRAVHLRDAYDRLCAARAARVGSVSPGYFPVYRAPAASEGGT
jgi:hypothetical protein